MIGFDQPRRLESVWANQPFQTGLAVWFGFVHVLALAAIPYAIFVGVDWRTCVLAGLLFSARHLSIRVGAHGYYSHESFELTDTWRAKVWEYANVILFTGTFQNDIKWWRFRHKRHHFRSDSIYDPYSVLDGFWWAHCGWILRVPRVLTSEEGEDFQDNVIAKWQKQYYLPTAIGVAFVFPTALAWLWGDAVGGLLVAGWLTLCAQYHFTWAVNSCAHTFGRKSRHETAKNNVTWILGFIFSLLTGGEWGKHGDHHDNPRLAYQRGWWPPDPGKWYIKLGEWTGIFCNVHVTDEEAGEGALSG